MAASTRSKKTGRNLPFSSKMSDICLQIQCREQRDYPPCQVPSQVAAITVYSTVSGHRQIRVTLKMFFSEWYSISIFYYPVDILIIQSCFLIFSSFKFDVGCRNLINWSRDHEKLDCTASRDSEITKKNVYMPLLKLPCVAII